MDQPGISAPAWPEFARQVIALAVQGRDVGGVAPPPDVAPVHGGVFVTLHKRGHLRGCMGTLDARTPLVEAVRHAARCAALEDPRFPPVTSTELPDIDIEVSILSDSWPMQGLDELELGRHGIIVQRSGRRGLFLPQVATDHHMNKETFLSRCCSEKAGLPPDAWRDPGTEVRLFTAEKFRED